MDHAQEMQEVYKFLIAILYVLLALIFLAKFMSNRQN